MSTQSTDWASIKKGQEFTAKWRLLEEAHTEAKAWLERVEASHERKKSLLEELRSEQTSLINGRDGDHCIPTQDIHSRVEQNEMRRKAAADSLELKVKDLEEMYRSRCEEKTRLQCRYVNRASVEERSRQYLKMHRASIEQLHDLREKKLRLDEREARKKEDAKRSGVEAASRVGTIGR